MDYLHKYDKNPYEDAYWNIPERRQGIIGIIGGNSQSFRSSSVVAEYITQKYPVESARVILPDALKTKLPPLDNVVFLSSTDTGSFADADEITQAINTTDSSIVIGDLSRNSITEKAIMSAGISSDKPMLFTRDAVDAIATDGLERLLMNPEVIIMGSLVQIQKVFRTVYYPKVILLSQSLVQITEALHKFTLSYPVSIITLHNNQIIVAKNGEVAVVPLEKSSYTPISIWNGELAAKIIAINLYNPNNFIKATVAAIYN